MIERLCETCIHYCCDGKCDICGAYQPDKEPTCCCIVHRGSPKECYAWEDKESGKFTKLARAMIKQYKGE